MFRLGGPQHVAQGNEPTDTPRAVVEMLHDDKTILAIVAAILYSQSDRPATAVDRAAELIREVNAR